VEWHIVNPFGDPRTGSGFIPNWGPTYTPRCVMETSTTTAMMMMNVDNKASGTSARHFHIAWFSGNYDNNYWQQRTTSVGWRRLVRKHTTYSYRVARWQCQTSCTSAPGFHLQEAIVRKCTWLSAIVCKRTSYISHCVLLFDDDNTQLCGQ